MNNKLKVTILAPCLNEINGLKIIMPQIKKEWYDQFIFLDAWSTDGSREWCEQNGYTVLKRSSPKAGIWEAYTEAFASGLITGDIVITFSPDGNSIPESIPRLVSKINEGYDLVIGSRYYGGMVSPDDTFLTKIGNRVLTGICNMSGKFHYTDALVMLRAYRREIIDQLRFKDKPNRLQQRLIKMSPLYSFEPSLSIRANKAKMKISEIPALEPQAYRERRQNTWVHGLMLLTQIVYENWLRKK